MLVAVCFACLRHPRRIPVSPYACCRMRRSAVYTLDMLGERGIMVA